VALNRNCCRSVTIQTLGPKAGLTYSNSRCAPAVPRCWRDGDPSDRRAKNEEGPAGDQGKPDHMIPGDRLIEINRRENRKHRERDYFLNGLELRGRIDCATEAVGWSKQYSTKASAQLMRITANKGVSL
jgi:hypothetical protein